MNRIAAVTLMLACASSAQAQVVRGRVTDRISGQPLAGVVVSVASASDSIAPGGIRHGLSDVQGEFAVSLPRAGSWLLSAKRIGVARFSTPVFTLAAGETRRFDITLEPFQSVLPTVVVDATPLCLRRPEQLRTIVALWDEARTALIAAEVSRRDLALTGWLSRYTRELDPISLRILSEHRSVSEGRFDRPMRSLSGDSLARLGYWRRLDDESMEFYGPDAEALLSEPFQIGHCFEMVQGRGDRRGLLGISFTPRTVRLTGGIEGTIWMDVGTFELRFVEFRYTNLITMPSNPHVGGAVHFLRHEHGAWVVRRWYIRMPQFPTVRAAVSGLGGSQRRQAFVYRIIEDGGSLYTPGLVSWEAMGSISGRVVDSTGRAPLRGSVVSLSGTPHSVEVDSSGAFRFDSIAPGAYALLASHRDYAGLGQLVDDEPLTLAPGQRFSTTMRASATRELRAILCRDEREKPGAATLRVLVTHAETGGVIRGLPIWLQWPDTTRRPSLNPTAPPSRMTADFRPVADSSAGVQSIADAGGAVVFCGVPADTRLDLHMLRRDDDPTAPGGTRAVRLTSVVLKAGEVTSRSITVTPPQ